jgi:galactokinase
MTRDYEELLMAAGMGRTAARAKTERFAEAGAALVAMGAGASDATALFVPGRLEVLGKHTDYAGGRSLLCAVERGICMVVTPRSDRVIRVVDARAGDEASFAFAADLEPPLGRWTNYPMTVARRLARNFPELHTGADMAFASDLPVAAGISSSSALVVAVYLALDVVNRFERSAAYQREISGRERLAAYLGCLENGESFGTLAGDRGVGLFGGSEDQTAILCCQPGMISQFSFCPVRAEGGVAVPAGYTFVIADSGVVAEKTGAARAAYNRASVATRVILRLWNEATGRGDATLATALASGVDAGDRIRAVLGRAIHGEYPSDVLVHRFDQFAEESGRIIPAARAALGGGDLVAFGALVDESQSNVERWLGNQIAETVTLQRQAREMGAAAASAFGAGFGGSVWALVEERASEEFARRWMARYRTSFPAAGSGTQAFVTGAGPAAVRMVNPDS